MPVEEFFQSIYVACRSDNSFGAKIRLDKVEEFKRMAESKARVVSNLGGALIKYEYRGAIINFVAPNRLVIKMGRGASLEDAKKLLGELLGG